MSTLTSAQLHVKRSSTRLHAPPGGVSSISFGPGGLGTVEEPATPDNDKAASADPAAAPPSRMGGYTPSYGNNSAGYDYTPPPSSYQRAGAPGGFGSSTPAYSYSTSSSNNSSSGGGGGSSGVWGQQQSGRPFSGASVCSSRSWGSQPPLTSSKRDQNWERKRRQWLARKNGGGGSYRPGSMAAPPSSPSQFLPSPPMPATPFGNSPWDDAGAPPSPLSKFVHQQSQRQSTGFGGYAGDYERIGTAAPSAPPPTASGGYPRDSYSCYTSSGCPPSRCGSATGTGAAMSQFAQAAMLTQHMGGGYAPPSTSSFTATAASRGGQPAGARAPSAAGGEGDWAKRNVSSAVPPSARQPPGGHSNWSPFG